MQLELITHIVLLRYKIYKTHSSFPSCRITISVSKLEMLDYTSNIFRSAVTRFSYIVGTCLKLIKSYGHMACTNLDYRNLL